MIGAVVLAAGLSTRMGTQKLLLPYAGQPLIRHVADRLYGSRLSEVVVVTGHDRTQIEAALSQTSARLVHNSEYRAGMLSSIRTGVRALPEGLAVMIVLGDQPALSPSLVEMLVQQAEARPGGIFVPVCRGRRGHPMVFDARFRQDVLTKYDDVGLRGLLRDHSDAVFEIAVDEVGILTDLDTPADYEEAIAKLREENAG